MKRMVWIGCIIWMCICRLQAQETDTLFYQKQIDKAIFSRIQGKSYKEGCTVPLSDLRYLKVMHHNGKGEVCQGELICHRSISDALLDIFRQLYEARYPIERMVLVDEYGADDEASMADNNTSAFNFRYISGTRSLSKHSLGMAIDINPFYNPYVRKRGGKLLVSPNGADEYVDRNKSFPYKIDRNDLCYKLFKAHGFSWGGDWKNSKDYQHFEKK